MKKNVFIDCRRILNSGIGRVTEWFLENVIPNIDYNIKYVVTNNTISDYKLSEKDCLVVNFNPMSFDELYILPQLLVENKCDLFISPQINVSPFHVCKTINMLHDLWYIKNPSYLPDEDEIKTRFQSKNTTINLVSGWLTLDRANYLLTDYGRELWLKAKEKRNPVLDMCWSQIALFSFSASRIVCVTSQVAEDFKKIFNRNTGVVAIENSLSDNWLNLSPNLMKNRCFICLAKLEERKKILELLKSYDIYCRSVEDPFSLTIAGDLGYEKYATKVFETINQINNKYNRNLVVFLKSAKTEQVKSLLTSSSLLVNPSEYESFGYPPLEAMAASLPVITTNTGKMRDSIGNYATKFDCGNILQLSQLFHDFHYNQSKYINKALIAKDYLLQTINNNQRISDWKMVIESIW